MVPYLAEFSSHLSNFLFTAACHCGHDDEKRRRHRSPSASTEPDSFVSADPRNPFQPVCGSSGAACRQTISPRERKEYQSLWLSHAPSGGTPCSMPDQEAGQQLCGGFTCFDDEKGPIAPHPRRRLDPVYFEETPLPIAPHPRRRHDPMHFEEMNAADGMSSPMESSLRDSQSEASQTDGAAAPVSTECNSSGNEEPLPNRSSDTHDSIVNCTPFSSSSSSSGKNPRSAAADGACAGSVTGGSTTSSEARYHEEKRLRKSRRLTTWRPRLLRFRVLIERSKDERTLGIETEAVLLGNTASLVLQRRVSLRISRVFAKGLIANWNGRHQKRQINVGDFIVQVNRASTDVREVLQEIMVSPVLELRLVRLP